MTVINQVAVAVLVLHQGFFRVLAFGDVARDCDDHFFPEIITGTNTHIFREDGSIFAQTPKLEGLGFAIERFF